MARTPSTIVKDWSVIRISLFRKPAQEIEARPPATENNLRVAAADHSFVLRETWPQVNLLAGGRPPTSTGLDVEIGA